MFTSHWNEYIRFCIWLQGRIAYTVTIAGTISKVAMYQHVHLYLNYSNLVVNLWFFHLKNFLFLTRSSCNSQYTYLNITNSSHAFRLRYAIIAIHDQDAF